MHLLAVVAGFLLSSGHSPFIQAEGCYDGLPRTSIRQQSRHLDKERFRLLDASYRRLIPSTERFPTACAPIPPLFLAMVDHCGQR